VTLQPEHIVAIIAAALSAFAVVTGAALAFLGAWLKVRGDRAQAQASADAQKAVTKQQIDAQIDERVKGELEAAWKEIDELKDRQKTQEEQGSRVRAAFARILRAIAQQWPGPDAPNLDPADIDLLGDTMPPHWVRPRRTDPPRKRHEQE
jgi:uncharacterized protein HemX